MRIIEIRYLDSAGHWSCQTIGGDIEYFTSGDAGTGFTIHYKDGTNEDYYNFQYILKWEKVKPNESR